mgnify:CR=1 FL=1
MHAAFIFTPFVFKELLELKPAVLKIFNTREAYLLVAASMFIGLFVSLTFQGMIAGMENTILLDRIIVLVGELAIVVPALLILRQRQLKSTDVLPLKAVSPLTVVMALVLVSGVIGLTSVFEILVLPYFPIPDFLTQLEAGLFDGSVLANLILIIAAGFVAPIVEEYLFRGILQQSLFYRYGSTLPAIVVPTVIFALFHVAYLFYLPALIELIALAILLAWLMVKTANILIPIMVHGVFNLSSFTGLFINDSMEATTLSALGLPWIIVSTILFILGWVYYKNMNITLVEEVYLIPGPGEQTGHD